MKKLMRGGVGMTYADDRDIHDLTLGFRPRHWPTPVSDFLIRKVGEAGTKLLRGPRPIGSARRLRILDRFAGPVRADGAVMRLSHNVGTVWTMIPGDLDLSDFQDAGGHLVLSPEDALKIAKEVMALVEYGDPAVSPEMVVPELLHYFPAILERSVCTAELSRRCFNCVVGAIDDLGSKG